MTETERFFESVASSFDQVGDSLFERGQHKPGPLFKWVAHVTLLGRDAAAALPVLDAHFARFAWTGDLIRDLNRWSALTGTAALLEQAPEDRARTMIERLSSYGKLPEWNFQVVQSLLALSMLTSDEKGTERWSEATLRAAPERGTEQYTYEVLAMAKLELPRPAADLDVSADTTARIMETSLFAAEFNSAAPLVCAFQAVAGARGKSAASMLRNRLRRLDELVFGSGSTPLVRLRPPVFDYTRQGNGTAVLEIMVKALGRGELRVGPWDFGPITYDVPETLTKAIERVDRSKLDRRAAQQALRDDALMRADGICSAVLSLAPGVVMPKEHAALLKDRFLLGFEIARHHIEGLVASAELHVVPHRSRAK